MRRVRRLLPDPVDAVSPIELLAADERRPPDGRPWVLVNMITSIDGAVSVEGRSGALGSSADKAVFDALRAVPDVILAGSGTVLAENYGPPRPSADVQSVRRARGQAARPRLAISSATLRIGPESRVFDDPSNRPVIITSSEAPAARVEQLKAHADLLVAGQGQRVDIGLALRRLRAEHGVRVVLCEGGPTLNGSLVACDAIDELCISLSPVLAGGESPRLVAGGPPGLRPMILDRVLEADGMLFCRYLRDRRPT